jgi:DNA-binding CsgD family transcriptional regulator
LIDITEKQKAFEKLKLREEQLENNARDLKQMNEALSVLLKKREQDKIDIQNKVTENINQLVLPYLIKLGNPDSKSETTALLEIIRSNLNEITSGFSHQLSANYIGLSPKEIRVADLIRQGHKTKQIAQLLYLSPKTVESHRENIRKKLGIKNKKINLQSYLQVIK